MFVVSRSSSSSSNDEGGGGYTATLGLYAVSTVVELVAEPAYLLTLSRWETLTSTRVRVEGFAVAAKAIATLAALNLFDQRPTLEAYGWGQVAYAVTVLVGLESSLRRRRRHSSSRSLSVWAKIRKLSTKDDDRYFDRDVTRFAWALTKQGLVKQVLTEGDKLAVAKFGRAEDLGAYAVALNYGNTLTFLLFSSTQRERMLTEIVTFSSPTTGSLVARIVFQPLEESSRLYFSSQAATTEATTRRQRSSIARHLSRVLEFYSHLTLVLTLLVPPYVAPVLSVLLGPKWSRTTARVLVWYVYSLPFLAVNGILEACVSSVADERTLKWTSWWFALCTVAFASTVYVTMSSSSSSSSGWGSRGIILGNCVNMSMRIAFSSVFLSRYLTNTTDEVKEDQDKGDERTIEGKKEEDDALLHPTRWLPSVSTVVAFLIANQVCRQSEQTWTTTGRSDLRSLAVHVAIGAVVGTGCLGVMYVSLSHTLHGKRLTYLSKLKCDFETKRVEDVDGVVATVAGGEIKGGLKKTRSLGVCENKCQKNSL